MRDIPINRIHIKCGTRIMERHKELPEGSRWAAVYRLYCPKCDTDNLMYEATEEFQDV